MKNVLTVNTGTRKVVCLVNALPRVKQALAGLSHGEFGGLRLVLSTPGDLHTAMTNKGFRKLGPGDPEHFDKATESIGGHPVHQYLDTKSGKVHLLATTK